MEGKWLSILEYAAYKKKSISTVRRYIKANRVKHKDENGKYFIFVKNLSETSTASDREVLKLQLENDRLKREINRVIEINNEYKMLIDIYEKQKEISVRNSLPEVPQSI